MEWVQLDSARTLDVDLPRRPSAAGTFRVVRPSGSEAQAPTAATLDAVNTTASAGVAAGAQTIPLTSATGVTVGRVYLYDGPEDEGGESVTIKSIAGLTATLVRGTLRAHASGATFQGTRVSFAVAAVTATPVGRGYRIEYAWPAGDLQPTFMLPFSVTRYVPQSHLRIESLRTLDPILAKRMNSGTWLPEIIADAWRILLQDIATKADPGGFVGVIDLTTAHGYLVRSLIAETAGKEDDVVKYLDDMRERYNQERDRALATSPYDAKQSGTVEVGAGWYQGIPWGRS